MLNYVEGSRFRPIVKPFDIEIVDKLTGELVPCVSVIGRRKKYDATPFIKLFDYGLLLNLSRSGICVLSYVMSILGYRDEIRFDIVKCVRYTGISRSSVYNGLNELLSLGVLRDGDVRGLYYVNPSVMFRGKREKFMK